MRVLRIFHSAVVDAWRERERQLRLAGTDVDLLTARRWNEGGADVRLVARPGEAVEGLRTWGRHPALFVYSPWVLLALLVLHLVYAIRYGQLLSEATPA